MPIERVIKSDKCLLEGVDFLIASDQRFAEAYGLVGNLELGLKPEGFERLFSSIVSQQVSVASADAIWSRLAAANLTSAENIRSSSESGLRECGLSRQKVRYAKALAEARIDFGKLGKLDSKDVLERLTEVKGIGTWTAQIYCIFSLGRADVFAPGDLALQETVRLLFDLEERPNEKSLAMMSQSWSPWRAVAARLLWAYYRIEKNREGIR